MFCKKKLYETKLQTSSKSVENKKQKLVVEKNLRNMFCQNWSINIFEKQSNHNLDKTTNSIHRKYHCFTGKSSNKANSTAKFC